MSASKTQPVSSPRPGLPISDPPKSILLLKPSSLGDIVHTLPAAAALKNFWPQARLRWLVNPEWAPILENNPAVDEVLLFPRKTFHGLAAPWKLIRWARQFAGNGASDLVLDFQCLLRTALIGKLCRLGAFYGLSDAREGARFWYDAAASVATRQHAVDRYLALLQMLGVPVPTPLRWPYPPTEPPKGFDSSDQFIVLHPFSRGKGKSLSVENVSELCAALAPARVILLGRSDLHPPEFPHVENWLNRTSLLELIAILQRAQWTVSVDSGPMHIAASLSPRVLSIHTWSDPGKVGPYPKDAWIWQNGRIFQQAHSEESFAAPEMGDIARWLSKKVIANPSSFRPHDSKP